MLTNIVIDYLFVVSVIVIWFMLVYQFALFALGWIYGVQAAAESRELAKIEVDLPSISLMIPARNEGLVITETLEGLLRLEYPKEKLEIIVINDGSTDDTGEQVSAISARDPRVKLFNVPKEISGRGKSAALNRGLLECTHQVIGIFDADNVPESDSIIHLARQLAADSSLGAVIGKFRCVNKKRNLLTRFINLESLAFQWIVQAGRWNLFRLSTLPGTNYLIRRPVLETLGGWDTEALTEDAEMSVRIYQAGYLIKFVPYAVTWEQEPETLRVWFRQRVRWARGNNYVLQKYLTQVFRIRPRILGLELLYSMSVYYIFFAAILVSDVLFVLSLTGLVSVPVPGPYAEVWLFAYLLFIMEVMIAVSHEREDSLVNGLLTALAYFTYCQLWIVVVLKAAYDDFVLRRAHVWAKTERFVVKKEAKKGDEKGAA
jgi:cellulose synthase/poly-beta-1,6-N-acetylglucosamine synthase-like glycosyltransferase